MDELSMSAADLGRLTTQLTAHKIRVTIDALPAIPHMADHALQMTLTDDRQAKDELGIRGVRVHDVKDLLCSHFTEELAADPDQIRQLMAAGATWVGPRHLAPPH
jgi:hypothetical protein